MICRKLSFKFSQRYCGYWIRTILTKLAKKKISVMYLKIVIRESLNIQYISLTVTRQIWYTNKSGRENRKRR